MADKKEIVSRNAQPLNKKQIRFLKALREDFLITRAAKKADIHRRTYYDWLEKSPEFKLAVEETEKALLVEIEERLKTQALNDQPWAIRFFLDRRHPKYRAKGELELSKKPEFYWPEDEKN